MIVARAPSASDQDVAAAADRRDLVGAARIERHVLPRQQQAGRAVLALERRCPRQRRLDGVAGPPDVELRDQAQRGGMLDRLVRRSVLAEADRVVRVDEDRADPHQRGHAHGVARIVGESEERADVGDESAVQGEAVGDRGHAELAHAEVDVVARRMRAHRLAARPVGEHRAGQIGGAADHFRQQRREGLDRLLRRLARRDRLGLVVLAAQRTRRRSRRNPAGDRRQGGAGIRRRARDARPRRRRSACSSPTRAILRTRARSSRRRRPAESRTAG